jgi:hypothetical protein
MWQTPLSVELDALPLQLLARLRDVVDVQRDRVRVALELEPERVGLHDRERERAGLELPRRHVPPARRELQAQHVAVEGAGLVEVPRRDADEVGAGDVHGTSRGVV